MNDIANDVELNKATLYLYFDNKEDLFFATVLRGVQIMISLIKEEICNSKAGLETILKFISAYNQFVLSYSDYYEIYTYFQSGRFDLGEIINGSYIEELNKNARHYTTLITWSSLCLDYVSPYAIDILNIRSELSKILTNAIKDGIEEGSIHKNLNPIDTAVMILLMVEGVQNIKPDFMKILETNGTNREQFKDYLEKSIKDLILNNED
ncbi:MAG: TetR/AcrR family transcriptional regulator [Methanobacterium sp. ERen5]|nr:MAG: TetR/AcrR family transcriptional regulator [Methanobacterium sp. ERen5]